MSKNKTFIQKLENFDLSTLDLIEKQQFETFSQSMSKVESLTIIINTVEGDFSQLSEDLALIAEEMYQDVE